MNEKWKYVYGTGDPQGFQKENDGNTRDPWGLIKGDFTLHVNRQNETYLRQHNSLMENTTQQADPAVAAAIADKFRPDPVVAASVCGSTIDLLRAMDALGMNGSMEHSVLWGSVGKFRLSSAHPHAK